MPSKQTHTSTFKPHNAKFGCVKVRLVCCLNTATMSDDLQVGVFAHFLNKQQRLEREWLKPEPASSSAGVFDPQQGVCLCVCLWRMHLPSAGFICVWLLQIPSGLFILMNETKNTPSPR